MNFIPSPLHPAVVHFPIVMILIGTVAALVAAITSRGHVRVWVAALLVLGALGTMAAVSTGEEDTEAVEQVAGVKTLLDAHEQWAERTKAVALVAAGLAIAALLTFRWPVLQRGLSFGCALAAVTASVCVYETGHRGGQLVYRHAVGVNRATADPAAVATSPAATRRSHRDD